MSDAFRSELQAAQERVRRAEEEVAELRAENAKLAERLSPSQRPLFLAVGGSLLVAITAAVTTLSAARGRDRFEEELRAQREVAAALSAQTSALQAAADANAAKCTAELLECRRQLPAAQRREEPCRCPPGDPLCSCAQGPDPHWRGLEAAAVERVVAAHRAGVKRACWERGASERSSASVTVTANLAPNGQVSSVSSSGDDPALGKCIESQVKSWTFPAPGSPTTINIPFKFVRQ
ncbi:MAG: AgmX/PglI C-terminal domain-containing protein [Labilithrix sp.]|nr:AgmX/PglI C-terminal domain-containing protein [Labilithrix sp.]MCW5812416.1 AgmX/PglI C-terminal domain-containing protein [Labilithrix sp.]